MTPGTATEEHREPPAPMPAAVEAASAESPLPLHPAEPWKWSWFRWQPGEGWTLFWVVLIHVLALTGLILFPLPGWRLPLIAYAMFWVGGLGTTIAYHRALAHRALKLNRVVEGFLVGAAFLNGSGSPATWTANHRFHHAHADGPEDISSPRLGGFWWAHLRWLWQARQSPVAGWAPDLDTPYWRFFSRWQVPLLACSLLVGLPFGWAAFFWLGPIRLVASLHAQCCANSIAHLNRRRRVGRDSSRNVAWLGPIQGLQGESWHRNHHANPALARLGRTWREIDLGWWVIVLLERLRLATDVRRPRAQRVAVVSTEPNAAPR